MQRIGTQSLRLWRSSATETLLLHFMQVRSKLPAQSGLNQQRLESAASSICKICSAPRWSTWKPSRHHRVAFTADSRRAKRGLWRWVIVAGLAASRVRHCWLRRYDATTLASDDWRVQRRRLPCSEARVGNQSWEREEEKAGDRSCPRIVRQLQFENLLNSLVCWWLKLIGFKVYSIHWSCEGSSTIRAFPVQ